MHRPLVVHSLAVQCHVLVMTKNLSRLSKLRFGSMQTRQRIWPLQPFDTLSNKQFILLMCTGSFCELSLLPVLQA